MESNKSVEGAFNKPSTKKGVTFADVPLIKQIENCKEAERLKEARKRDAFQAICELAEDQISEELLLKNLPLLDPLSWNEVIEERYLSRVCGYPLCSTQIQVDFRREFTLRNNKLVKTDSEECKFCSTNCLLFSREILKQLDGVDFSVALKKAIAPKNFVIPTVENMTAPSEGSETEQTKDVENERVEIGPKLIKSLFELKVADNTNEEESTSDESSDEQEEREFLQSIKNFVTSPKDKSKEVNQVAKEKTIRSHASSTSSQQMDTTEPRFNSEESANALMSGKSLATVTEKIKAKYELDKKKLEERQKGAKLIAPRNLNEFVGKEEDMKEENNTMEKLK